MLISLLNESPAINKEKIRALNDTQDHASRNHLIHALIVERDNQKILDFVKREARDTLKFKQKKFNGHLMFKHLEVMQQHIENLTNLFGIKKRDYNKYYKAVQDALGET